MVANPADLKKKRRRRRKARTEDFSSDSSSSSEDESQKKHDDNGNEDEDEDVEMEMGGADLQIKEQKKDDAVQKEQPHPRTQIPPQLKDVTTKSSGPDESFQNYYVELMTKEFGEDLDKLRQAKDFGPKSLQHLIQSLKEGSHMFNEEQRQIIQEK